MGFVTLEVDYFTLKTISRAVLLALTGLLMMIAKNIGTELCRAPTPTPTQTRLDSTPPNIGIGVTIVRDWSLNGAEFKTHYPVATIYK